MALAKIYLKNKENSTALIRLHLNLPKIPLRDGGKEGSYIHIISVRVYLKSLVWSVLESPPFFLVC